MIIPATYNFTIYAGVSFDLTMTWKDESGTVIDLTGYSAELQIRSSPSSPILADMSTENGKIVLAATAPNIVASLTPDDTGALPFNKARYDLKMTSGGGEVTRLIEGEVTLNPAITA